MGSEMCIRDRSSHLCRHGEMLVHRQLHLLGRHVVGLQGEEPLQPLRFPGLKSLQSGLQAGSGQQVVQQQLPAEREEKNQEKRKDTALYLHPPTPTDYTETMLGEREKLQAV